MEEKKFNCKAEDVPVLAGFLLKSYETDHEKFTTFSPVFNDQFVSHMKSSQAECYSILKPADVLGLQKVVAKKITDLLANVRISLNQVEGYLKLSSGELDIQVADFGLSTIRKAINNENLEGLFKHINLLLTLLKRNAAALQAKGMSTALITTIETQLQDITVLNENHNVKKNERSRITDENMKAFNNLWDSANVIVNAGRAIFRGVDDVKLKEYTMTALLKRVHNETSAATKAKAKEARLAKEAKAADAADTTSSEAKTA